MKLLSIPQLSCLLAATSTASAATIKAQYVSDGSFETVPATDNQKYNFAGGDWTFKNQATLQNNSDLYVKPTPFGTQYATFKNSENSQTHGSVTQQLSGIPAGKKLLLTYNFRPWQPPIEDSCQFNVTYGSQQLDYMEIYAESHGDITWSTRSLAIVPHASSGPLQFYLYCPFNQQNVFEVDLDNITIGGLYK